MTAVMEPAGMTRPAEDSERTESGAALSAASAELADAVDEHLVRQQAGRAVGAGLSLTGEGGLLQRLMKIVLRTGVERWRAGQRPVPSWPARRWMPRPAGGPAARDQADPGLSQAGSWREIICGSGSDGGSS
jgi:hypothetical protein